MSRRFPVRPAYTCIVSRGRRSTVIVRYLNTDDDLDTLKGEKEKSRRRTGVVEGRKPVSEMTKRTGLRGRYTAVGLMDDSGRRARLSPAREAPGEGTLSRPLSRCTHTNVHVHLSRLRPPIAATRFRLDPDRHRMRRFFRFRRGSRFGPGTKKIGVRRTKTNRPQP